MLRVISFNRDMEADYPTDRRDSWVLTLRTWGFSFSGRDSLLGLLMWEGEKEHPISSTQPGDKTGPGDKTQASILASSLLHPTRGLPGHGRQWKQRRHHTKFNWSEERGPKSCARQGKPSVLSIHQPALVRRGVQLYVCLHLMQSSPQPNEVDVITPVFQLGKGHTVSARLEADVLNPRAHPLHTCSGQDGRH